MSEPSPSLLSAETIAAMAERRFQHMFNPNGVRMTRSLSDACGMKQIGVHLVRVEPGRETTEYHTHSHDEEWIYILSGRATAEIGGRKIEVKAGDFMGFVAGSEPHTMKNESSEDLVYLVGGTRHAYDVVDYPRRSAPTSTTASATTSRLASSACAEAFRATRGRRGGRHSYSALY